MMEILEGCKRGSVMYYQDGYIYRRGKAVAEKMYLRCRVPTCFGTAVIVDDMLTHLEVHNHSDQDDVRERLLLKSRLKLAAERETTKLKDIFDRETKGNPFSKGIAFNNFSSTLMKRRKVAQGIPIQSNLEGGPGFLNYKYIEKNRKANTQRTVKKKPRKNGPRLVADDEIMLEGSNVMIKTVFGEDNWNRWQKVKEQTALPNFRVLLSWILDCAEQQLHYQCNISPSKTPSSQESSLTKTIQCGGRPMSTGKNNVEQSHYAHPSDEADTTQPLASSSTSSETWCLIPAEENMTIHISQHPRQKTFFCQECKLPFRDLDVIGKHVNLKHPTAVINITCSCCFESFSSAQCYTDFHRVQTILKDTDYKCELCPASFSSLSTLKEHKQEQHRLDLE